MVNPPEYVIDTAIKEANFSPCRKSKRGVVLWSKGFIIAANNSPPFPYTCTDRIICNNNCRKLSVHAEQRVLIKALNQSRRIKDAEMLHIKTINNQMVASKEACCIDCSKLILESEIKGIWLLLLHGWKFFNKLEFHRETLKNLKLL